MGFSSWQDGEDTPPRTFTEALVAVQSTAHLKRLENDAIDPDVRGWAREELARRVGAEQVELKTRRRG